MRGKTEGRLSRVSPLQAASKMSFSITEYQPLLPNTVLVPNINKQHLKSQDVLQFCSPLQQWHHKKLMTFC
jgi:hypothetical protein